MPDPVRPDIGSRLRAEREAQRQTLEQVAEASGLSKGYLSKVERDVATPSVAALLRVCRALDLAVGELFEHSHDRDLVRAEERPSISFGGERMEEALLTPYRERRLQVIHSLIRPGGGSGEERYELPSDVEFLFVVRGRLRIRIDGLERELASGDALTFAPSAPHSFDNPSGVEDAEVLWVLTPALPLGDGSATAAGPA